MKYILMPFVMDSFGQWGPVAKCMLYSKCEKITGVNKRGRNEVTWTSNAIGSSEVLTVWDVGSCKQRMEAYSSGQTCWRYMHMYADSPPQSWAKHYLAHSTIWMLAQHVLPAMQVVEMEKAQCGTPQSTAGDQSAPVQMKVWGYSQYCAENPSFVTQLGYHNAMSLGESSVG